MSCVVFHRLPGVGGAMLYHRLLGELITLDGQHVSAIEPIEDMAIKQNKPVHAWYKAQEHLAANPTHGKQLRGAELKSFAGPLLGQLLIGHVEWDASISASAEAVYLEREKKKP
jgi:hypothetical protein